MDTSDDVILIRLAGFSVQSILPRDVFSAIHFRFVVEAVLHAICFYQGLGRGFNPSTTLRDNSPLSW